MAEVFERQSNWVKVGHPAEVEFSYLPGKKFEGVVEYVYPDLDEMTRALTVRLKFENFDESLKPNMFGDVSIFAGAKNNIIVVPREAIIRTGSDERVILAKGSGRFEPREVVVGMESGDWIEVKSGLEAGEEVVISGQFLIDSEVSTKASFMRMSTTKELDDQENNMAMSEDAAIVGMGTITKIYKGENILKIDHQPIEVLDWPRMEMKFSTEKDNAKIDFNALSIGDHIQFEMKKIDGKYLITTVTLMNQEGGQ